MGSPRRKLNVSGADSSDSPQRNLRVLFDARKIGHGGIGTVISSTLAAFALQPDVKVSAIVNSNSSQEVPLGIEVIEDDTRDFSFDHIFKFSRRLNLNNYDLFHVPHYFIPSGINIPLVVTVHDTTHITHPEKIFYPLIARNLIKLVAYKAARIITVSQASYESLRQIGVPASKLRVIVNPLSIHIKPHLVQQRSGLLAVLSNLKPHKGLSDLLAAFAIARAKHPQLKLTLAGLAFRNREHPLVKSALNMPGVAVLGALSQAELDQEYARCSAVIIPSRAEGFGLMVTEAHAHATAVLARPVAALKEILAPSDRVATDMSIEALSELIESFALQAPNPPSAHFMSLERMRFDPSTVVRATLDVYREVCR